MNDYFERELKSLEAELTQLKTSKQKSSATMDLVTKVIPVSVSLEVGEQEVAAYGYEYYVAKSDGENIIFGYLSWYSEDVQKNWISPYEPDSVRQAQVDLAKYNDDILLKVAVRGSRRDFDALAGGSSVVANMNLVVIGVKEFEVQKL